MSDTDLQRKIIGSEQIIKRYTEDRKLIPYCGIVISWLEKELKITERTTDHEPYSTRKK